MFASLTTRIAREKAIKHRQDERVTSTRLCLFNNIAWCQTIDLQLFLTTLFFVWVCYNHQRLRVVYSDFKFSFSMFKNKEVNGTRECCLPLTRRRSAHKPNHIRRSGKVHKHCKRATRVKFVNTSSDDGRRRKFLSFSSGFALTLRTAVYIFVLSFVHRVDSCC